MYGQKDCLEILIQNGADVNLKNVRIFDFLFEIDKFTLLKDMLSEFECERESMTKRKRKNTIQRGM